MKLLFDLHTHTVASGHAFSTLKENIEEAAAKGLKAMGTSDHYSAMPGSAQPIYFTNFKAIKEKTLGAFAIRSSLYSIYIYVLLKSFLSLGSLYPWKPF